MILKHLISCFMGSIILMLILIPKYVLKIQNCEKYICLETTQSVVYCSSSLNKPRHQLYLNLLDGDPFIHLHNQISQNSPPNRVLFFPLPFIEIRLKVGSWVQTY